MDKTILKLFWVVSERNTFLKRKNQPAECSLLATAETAFGNDLGGKLFLNKRGEELKAWEPQN